MNKPTIRIIKKILNNKLLWGYNDKRKNGGRIKLRGQRITPQQHQLLQQELAARFPNYKIMCNYLHQKDLRWHPSEKGPNNTVVHFKEIA